MKRSKHKRNRPLPRALFIREPILPVSVLDGLFSSASKRPVDALEKHCDHELRELFSVALALASPSLAMSMLQDSVGGIAPKSTEMGKVDKVDYALLKYIIRASSRATPFGLFSSVFWVPVRDESTSGSAFSDTNSASGDKEHTIGSADWRKGKYKKHLQPSSTLLYRWVRELERDPWVEGDYEVYVNPALLFIGSRLKVVYRDGYGQGGDPGTCWMKITPPLGIIIEKCQNPVHVNELVSFLQEAFPESAREQIWAYLIKLLDEGVLLSTLRPPPSKPIDIRQFAELNARFQDKSEYAKNIVGFLRDLDRLQQNSVEDGQATITKLLRGAGYSQGKRQDLLQATLFIDAPSTYVPAHTIRNIHDKLVDAAIVLCKLFPQDRYLDHLVEYSDAFRERYGMREVPLLELLDDDVGLGPPPTYNEPPALYNVYKTPPNQLNNDDYLYSQLSELVFRAAQDRLYEISLPSELIGGKPVQFPDTADAVFNCWKPRGHGNPHLVLSPVGYIAGAGRVMSRFAHLDSSIANYLESSSDHDGHTAQECVVANVDYLHRVGHYGALNYQIARDAMVYVSSASSENAHIGIRLDSIRVGLNGDTFYLIAPVRGKDTLLSIRNRTMFNPILAPNIIRFMYEVSSYDTPPVPAWDWGPLSHLPALPRVVYNDVVLSLAKWRIPSYALSALNIFTDWWREKGIPRFVFIGHHDNRLIVDLESPRSYELIAREKVGVLEEAPHPEEQDSIAIARALGLKLDIHPFAEYVLSLSFRASTAAREGQKKPSRSGRYVIAKENGVQSGGPASVIFPGDQPVYLKLYAPDIFHTDIAYHIRRALGTRGDVKWYFVRYQDPKPHLRVRLYTTGTYFDALARMSSIAKEISSEIALQHWSAETYFPEVERYGGVEGLQLAEEIFFYDTILVLWILEGKFSPNILHVAFATNDYLLKALGYSLEERAKIYSVSVSNFVSPSLLKQYRKSYWKSRNEYIDNYIIISKKLEDEKQIQVLRKKIRDLANRYRELDNQGKLLYPFSYITLSLLHMHSNRLGLLQNEEMAVVSSLDALYSGFSRHIPPRLEGFL